MCSGLPTPGSEVTLCVARINLNPCCALVELWGEIEIPKVRFSESDGKAGDLCLAYLNGTWHRARITSRHGRNYDVFFIDEGRSHIATSSTLAWGQNNLFLLPPEVEFCVLADVSPISHENKWSPAATDFLKSLYGKTLKGIVQHVLMPDRTILLSIPAVSKYMYEVGFARKIPTDQSRDLVLSSRHPGGERIPSKTPKLNNAGCELKKSQQYLYPELLTGAVTTVEFTEVVNRHRIFCKLSIFSQELKKLSEQIQEYYEDRTSFSKGRPQVSGSPCAIKGSNGKWYRSVLQQDLVPDRVVEVMHVDCGKMEFVHEGDIRPLDDRFLRMPVVTYLCSIDGMKEKGTRLALDQVENLRSAILHQTVIARFESYDLAEDIYHITFDGDSIMDFQFRNPFDLSMESLQRSVHTLPCFQALPPNDRKEDSSHVKMPSGSSKQVAKECSGPERQNGGHLPPCFSLVKDNIVNEHLLPEGMTVGVNVPYVESAAKFWCQLAEESHSLVLLMQNMQCYYDSAPPQQPDELLCVARHPDNGMWYRAWIIANHRSPLVDVRLIDYGHTRKIPLQNLRKIDPAFLLLKAQAFQCCLHNPIHPTSPAPDMWSDAAIAEFHKFIDLATSNFKCTVYEVIHDSQGILHMVDIETPFQSACKLLSQPGKHDAAHSEGPTLNPVVPATYNYPMHINVGGKAQVLITCSDGVSHFYGQLGNSCLLDELKENIQKCCQQLQSSVCPLVENTICFAKSYTDNLWYRGLIKATQPKLQVHFVDYGHTVAVNESDIRPFPVEASTIRAVPVQAIPFGLFNVPEHVSPEANSWFKNHVTSHYLTISVVAKCSDGKLIVELHDGTTNLNMKVRDMLEEERLRNCQGLVKNTPVQALTQHSSQSSTLRMPGNAASRGYCQTRETQPPVTQNASVHSAKRMGLQSEQGTTGQQASPSQISQRKPASSVAEHEKQASGISRITDLPPRLVAQGLVTEVYVSHCNSPSSFFVHLKKEEDGIYSFVAKLNGSQSLGEAPVDPKEVQLGDLVNALYPEDSSWYRAAVKGKQEDGTVHVEFIDFGNEASISCLHIRQLDKQFAEFPRFCIPCGLEVGKRIDWDQEAISMFKQMTEDSEKTFVCTFLKETGSVWEVTLEDQGLMLSEAVVQQCQSVELNKTQLSCPQQSNSPLEYVQPLTQRSSQSSTLRMPDHAASREYCQMQETEPPVHSGLQSKKTENASVHSAKGMGLQSEQGPTGQLTSPSQTSQRKPASSVAEHEKQASGISRITDLPPRLVAQGLVTEVYVSHCNSPSSFFVHLKKEEDDIYSLVAELNGSQSLGEAPVDPKEVQLGDLVNALYPEDSSWYRAAVKGKQEDGTVHVEFIDFGNEATISCLHVRQLDKQCAVFPRFSIPCGLKVGKRIDWDQEAVSMFKQMTEDSEKTFTCTFVKEKGLVWEVTLEDQGLMLSKAFVQQCQSVDLNNTQLSCSQQSNSTLEYVQALTQHSSQSSTLRMPDNAASREYCQMQETELPVHSDLQSKKTGNASVHSAKGMGLQSEQGTTGQQTSPSQISQRKPASSVAEHEKQASGISRITDLPPRLVAQGLVTEVYVSHCNSPSSFFVHLKKEEDDIYSLVAKLNGSQSLGEAPVDLKEVQLGDLVNALYPEDSSWYRAAVRGKQEDGTVHVEFIDFGNEANISCLHIRQLDKQFAEIPRFSIPCGLEVGKRIDWDQEAVSMFKQMTEDSEKTFVCTFVKETGSVWEVTLADQGLMLSEAVVQQCSSVELNKTQLSWPQQSNCPLEYVQALTQCSSQSSTLRMPDNAASREYCQMQETETPVHSSFQSKKTENVLHHSSKGMSLQSEQGTTGQQTSPSQSSQRKPASSVAEKQTSGISRITDLPPRLVAQGLVTEVYVSHCNSPSSFFVHLKKEEDDIYSLVAKLNGSQSLGEAPVDLKEVQLGDLVNALYPEDSSWYRAAVKGKQEDGTVHVEFIDFGNEATISCLDVRQLDEQCAEFPRFSIPCGLKVGKRIDWDQEAVSMFKQMTEDSEKTFACTFVKETGSVWEVTLEDHGHLLSEALVQQCRSVDLNNTRLSRPQQSNCPLEYKKLNISVGQTEEVYASSISGPRFFWCQYANSFELKNISKLAQEVGNSAQENVFVTDGLGPGSPCLGLFAEDKQWYRAQVIRKTGDMFNLLFVDYGNESHMNVKSVRSAPLSLVESTPQAFLCSLEGYEESQGTWDDDASDQLYELLVDRPLRVTIGKIYENGEIQCPQYMVKIECDEISVNEKMKNYWKISTTKDSVMTYCSPHPYEEPKLAGKKLDDETIRRTLFKAGSE